MGEKKTKLNLRCDDKTWISFKEITPKTKTLNDCVLVLIQKAVKNGKL